MGEDKDESYTLPVRKLGRDKGKKRGIEKDSEISNQSKRPLHNIYESFNIN
jgi:hypothetical protein